MGEAMAGQGQGQSMRVALITERYATWGGGHERSTAQIVEELCRRGWLVTVLAAVSEHGRGESTGAHGEAVRSMGLKRVGGAVDVVRFAWWVERELGRAGADVSIAMTTAASADVVQPRGGTVIETMARNRAMRKGAWRRGVKRLTQWLLPKQRALVWAERRTLRHGRLRRLVAVSAYVAWQASEHYGLTGESVVTIPNAAVMPTMSEEETGRLRGRMRSAWGVDEGAVVFVFAAVNPRLKGLGTLVEAMRLMKGRGLAGWSVWLAGSSGYGVYDGLRKAGVADRAVVVGATREMAALYAAADVVVLPTYYDPSSKVVIEGLMMGRPAITTRFNGAADFVTPDRAAGDRGIVIDDPGDAEALAEAMSAMLDGEKRRGFAEAIGAGLAEELSMARHVDRLEAVLTAVSAEKWAG